MLLRLKQASKHKRERELREGGYDQTHPSRTPRRQQAGTTIDGRAPAPCNNTSSGGLAALLCSGGGGRRMKKKEASWMRPASTTIDTPEARAPTHGPTPRATATPRPTGVEWCWGTSRTGVVGAWGLVKWGVRGPPGTIIRPFFAFAARSLTRGGICSTAQCVVPGPLRALSIDRFRGRLTTTDPFCPPKHSRSHSHTGTAALPSVVG